MAIYEFNEIRFLTLQVLKDGSTIKPKILLLPSLHQWNAWGSLIS